jgi:hypothetical protein
VSTPSPLEHTQPAEETDHHGVGDEPHQKPKPKQPECQHEHADQEAEDHEPFELILLPNASQRFPTLPNASKVAKAVAPVESTFMITELVKNAATVVPAIIEQTP